MPNYIEDKIHSVPQFIDYITQKKKQEEEQNELPRSRATRYQEQKVKILRRQDFTPMQSIEEFS